MSSSLCTKCLQLTKVPLIPLRDNSEHQNVERNAGFLFGGALTPVNDQSEFYESVEAFCQRYMAGDVRRSGSIFWHHTMEELICSADTGCSLCKLVVCHCKGNCWPNYQLEYPLSEYLAIPMLDVGGDLRNLPQEPVNLFLDFILLHKTDKKPQFHYSKLHSLLVNEADGPRLLECSEEQRKGRDGRSMRSSTLRRLSSWLKCHEKHLSCRETAAKNAIYEGILPSRLLRLEESEPGQVAVYLIEVGDAQNRHGDFTYATLSHRWGVSMITSQLHKANYTRYLHGIAIDSLPLTFRDAIKTTLTLGLSYLWIDALCIIQDDPSDWRYEAPRMAPIFANCKVNLAATSSESPDGGLMLQVDELMGCAVSVSWFAPFISRPAVVWIGHTVFSDVIPSEPLNLRAWVFQEKLLSPRTIHFSFDQIWWECTEQIENEGGVVESQAVLNSISADLERGEWRRLVEAYALTELTYPSDRLVAFSGVAQAFAHRFRYDPNDYMAGLWKSDLREQLLWETEDAPNGHFALQDRDTSPSSVTPSWSWASAGGSIYFRLPQAGQLWNKSYSILSVSVERSSESAFAHFIAGTVKVRSILHRFTLSDYIKNIDGMSALQLAGKRFSDVRLRSNLTFLQNLDPLPEGKHGLEFSGMNCVFLPMLFTPDAESFQIYGLLLSSVEGHKGIYRRYGVMTLIFRATCGLFSDGTKPLLWWEGTSDLDDSLFIRKHDNGVYDIDIV